VDRAGVVKVMDMGVARVLEGSEEVLTRTVLGTPDYVAPEQSKDSHNVDIRADVYSLGCTFWFLLTGSPPFPEGTVAQKFVWHQTRAPRPIRALRPEVPEGLAAIVHRLLEKDPAKRYQTPAEVAAALLPWTQGIVAAPTEKEVPRTGAPAPPAKETATDLSITPLDVPLPGTLGPVTIRGAKRGPASQPRLIRPEPPVGGPVPVRPEGAASAIAAAVRPAPRPARPPARPPFSWGVLVVLGLLLLGAGLAWWLHRRGVF